MGMRSQHKEEQKELRRQYLERKQAQEQMEENAWGKVVEVLAHSDHYLTASQIAVLAHNGLTVKEVEGNMRVVARAPGGRTSWGQSHKSHSGVLQRLQDSPNYRLDEKHKEITKRFVEIDENGRIVPGSEIHRTRRVSEYKIEGRK